MGSSASDGARAGAPARDRSTDAVWQGPTWVVVVALVVLHGGGTGGADRAVLWCGVLLVVAAAAATVLAPWHRMPPWRPVLVPATGLLGACLLAVALPGAGGSTVLVLTMPVAWLSFEFGPRALLAGALATVGVAATTLAGGGADEPGGVVVAALFIVALAVAGRLMSGVLDQAHHDLQAQSVDLAEALAMARSSLLALTGVMESIDAGVVVVRPGLPPLLNEQALRLAHRAGLDPERPRSPGAQIFLDDGQTPAAVEEQAWARAVAGQEFTGVVHWIGPAGDQRAVVTSARQLHDDQGASMGSVVAAWDATDLMHAIRIREEFVTTVSHELRTPLTAISASLELLVDVLDTSDPRADHTVLLGACVRNADLLGARVAELLVSTSSPDGAMLPRTTDVTELVRVALTKHQSSLASSGLALRVDLPVQVVAEIDPTRFEQVVDNLVSNAVKYTPTGTITVSLRATPDTLVLTVADTGVGMTPDELRQACTRFYRAPAARSAAIRGLGIGLSLVQGIVERHAGVVRIESAPGAGTSVVVTLPLSRAAVPDA